MRRSHVLSLLALVIIGVGSAVAFTVVVWPTRYAKGVLEFERAFRSPDSPFVSSASLSGDDIEGALRRINQWNAFLADMEERIEALRPAPPQYRELQEDLEAGIQWFQEQIAALEQHARFVGGARELHTRIKGVLAPGAGALTVGQFLERYDPELTKIRETGDALFKRQDLPRAPEIAELRAAWTDAAASFDLLRSTLRAQPPGRSLQGAIEQLRTAELRAAEETLERFTRRLEAATTTPGPSLSSPESASAELRERFERIGATLDALRQRYPENAIE